MIGIGVIGAGYWGPNLMRNFAVQEDWRLQDILEGDEIQGVAIATPVHSHFELASRVVAAGKSVLVEKPLA
mgnify:CR=1 FL=1